jgi:hypothetical protein
MKYLEVGLLVCLTLLSAGFAGAYQRVDSFPGFMSPIPVGGMVADRDGVILGVQSEEFVEIKEGKISKRFSIPGMYPSKAVFGPGKTRFLLFWNSEGSLMRVYDHAGVLSREVHCPNLPRPFALSVDNGGAFVVLVYPQQNASQPQPLLYRYDSEGELVAKALMGVMGRGTQQFRIAAGGNGQVAVLKSDDNILHWLDKDGAEILKLPVVGRFTAMGFSKGRLLVVQHKAVQQPQLQGTFVAHLSSPELVQLKQDGTSEVIPLPAEATGVNQIESDGALIRTTQGGVAVFERKDE